MTTDFIRATVFQWSQNRTALYASGPLYIASSTVGLTTNSTQAATVVPSPDTTVGHLRVYGADGQTLVFDQDVTSSGQVTIPGLNNDAIKVEVTGTKGVNVWFEVKMQSLDPYINKMNIVCSKYDAKIIRQFTSSDFAVAGGKFYFYIPTEWLRDGQPCKFLFSGLYSRYGDASYPDGSAAMHARYNFVRSEYYDKFGLSNNNIYNAPEVAASNDYSSIKTITNVAGTQEYKFNNAKEVDALGANATIYFREYPFTLERYQAQVDANNENAQFAKIEIVPGAEGEEVVRNAYVFTADETRYNIAPTTQTQHRAYAYYDMELHLIAKTYNPQVTLKKVYDNSFYGDMSTGALYGMEVSALDGDGKNGFCSVEDAAALLAEKVTNGEISSTKQILYVDMAKNLEGTYSTTDGSWSRFRNSLSPNALVFLPSSDTRDEANFASKDASGNAFRANRDIVIVDQQPFYSPYQVNVDAASRAVYKRMRTSSNAIAKLATLVLPFTIAIDNQGRHATDSDTPFTVYKMANGGLRLNEGRGYSGRDYHGESVFTPAVPVVGATVANVPYAIKVDDEYVPTEENVSFVISQRGATIWPTPSALTDAQVSGTIGSDTYHFTPTGTYSGVQVTQVFYFGNNHFYNSTNLKTETKAAKMFPFRAFYAYSTEGEARMLSFDMVFGEVNNENISTGVDAPTADAQQPDLAVAATDGTLSVFARRAQTVVVRSVNGATVARLVMGEGETQQIPLAKGIYVVNKVKIVVR